MVEWRPIPGFFGYEASKCGSDRSIDRVIEMKNGRKRRFYGVVLRPSYHSNEFRYPQVNFGKMGTHKVHYLMAITWVGPKPGDQYQVRHLDGNPENCAASNLKWGTPTDNQEDRFLHGTASVGMKSGVSVLTDGDVIEIRRALAKKIPQSKIGEMFGISQSHVSHINTNRNWSHV